jgi:hypothetical protein
MSAVSSARAPVITLPRLGEGQWQAFWALQAHRFKALRCGRRFGKTEFAKAWIGQGLVQGEVCAWFAPQHMTSHEVHRGREDDLLDTFCYGIALALGNSEGF